MDNTQSQAKQVEIRQEQMIFLKQTILTLEAAYQAQLHQNQQLKSQLKQFAHEIGTYNEEVITKIYDQNASVQANNLQLQQNLRLCKAELIKLKEEEEANSKQKQRLGVLLAEKEKKISVLERQNKKLSVVSTEMSLKNEQMTHDLSYFSAQIDLLTNKHQQSLRNSEKKMKTMVGPEIVDKLKLDISKLTQSLTAAQSSYETLTKKHNSLRFECATYKDKALTLQLSLNNLKNIVSTDLINLHNALKIDRKIVEFQSEYSDMLDAIYHLYRQKSDKVGEIGEENEKYREQVAELDQRISQMKRCIETVQIEHSINRERQNEEKEELNTQYQQKFMHLALKIKKEEMAMNKLHIIEGDHKTLLIEHQKLLIDHEALKQQFSQMGTAQTNTIQALQKQNQEVALQLQQTLQMWENNLHQRNLSNLFKSILHDTLTVLIYLFNHPSPPCLLPHRSIPHNRHNRLKVYTHMIIAILRLKKSSQSYPKTYNSSDPKHKLLLHQANKAIGTRNRIEKLDQHLNKLVEMVEGGRNLGEILQVVSAVYRWKPVVYLSEQHPPQQFLRPAGKSGAKQSFQSLVQQSKYSKQSQYLLEHQES